MGFKCKMKGFAKDLKIFGAVCALNIRDGARSINLALQVDAHDSPMGEKPVLMACFDQCVVWTLRQ